MSAARVSSTSSTSPPGRRRLVFQRLLERRLLGDGEAMVSIIPGAFLTLGIASFGFTLVAQERALFELALLLAAACLAWSALKAFLDARDATESSLDRAVLEPLPIPPRELREARFLVEGVFLAIGALNLALPAVVIAAFVYGPRAGAALALGAALATLTGMALGQAVRAAIIAGLGARRLGEWEGPLRLLVSIGLFGLLFAAPDPGVPLSRWPWLIHAPPFSFAALLDGRVLAAALTGVGALALLLLTARVGHVDDGAASGAGISVPLPLRWLRDRLVRPQELASFDFALANIARDRSFRARVFPMFAFPFAVVALVASRPADPHLALLALFGVPVYLVLSQTFLEFTESTRGPVLLASLPIADVASFRLGAEKAFLIGLLAPIFLALVVALVTVSLLVASAALLPLVLHAVHALLFSILLCALFFERHAGLAFSHTDRGVYPADLGSGPFLALFSCAALALVSVRADALGIGASLVLALLLAAVIPATFAWKRGRARSVPLVIEAPHPATGGAERV